MSIPTIPVTALPRQLQTLPCVPEFAELNSLAMRRRAFQQARLEFYISDELRTNDMQQGSVIRQHRKIGPDVWCGRWREAGPNGNRVHRLHPQGKGEGE